MNELIDARHGKMLVNRHDIYIGKAIVHYGEYCEGEVDVFRQIIQPGWWIVELGANLGAHTVVLSKLTGPQGRVLAFEPQRIIFQNLCANVALNNLKNVYAYQLAVGEAPAKVFIPDLDYDRENNFGGLALGEYQSGESVDVVTLDSLQLPACHFIKADVEGMEKAALLGAKQTIEKYRPILYVENDRQDKSTSLVRTLDRMGYSMYWHKPRLYNPQNYFQNPVNRFGEIASHNMILHPPFFAAEYSMSSSGRASRDG